MPALPEAQRRLAAAVFEDDAAVLAQVRVNGLEPARRLAVYRNNTLKGLALALADGFPVVRRLVGDEFFAAMARAFVRRHPPASGCLLDYGAELAGFIESFEPAAALPYLPDVARLEWAWHLAFHAEDAAPLRPEALQTAPPEQEGDIRLRLHPSARLLASAWPVLRIFEANQPGRDGRVDLDRGTGCRALVVRPDLDVELHALQAGEFALLQALDRGCGLVAAFEQASAAEPGFDLTSALLRGFERGVFSGFRH
jgi:hypothetical protein